MCANAKRNIYLRPFDSAAAKTAKVRLPPLNVRPRAFSSDHGSEKFETVFCTALVGLKDFTVDLLRRLHHCWYGKVSDNPFTAFIPQRILGGGVEGQDFPPSRR